MVLICIYGGGEPKQKWPSSVFGIRDKSWFWLEVGGGRGRGDPGVSWCPAKEGGSWFMADKWQELSL